MKPHYAHDCPTCHLLGTIDVPPHLNQEDKILDLYYCNQGSFGGTVIARFGSAGPDYMSGLGIPQAFANEKINEGLATTPREALNLVVADTNHLTKYALSIAALKAMDMGLLDDNLKELG